MIGVIQTTIESLIPQRVELIHPLTVHFPVALLLCGTGVWILALITHIGPSSEIPRRLRWFGLGMIVLGTIAGLAALKTGELAEEVVNQVICDPELTNSHEDWADRTMIIFAAGLVIALFQESSVLLNRLFGRSRWPVLSGQLLATIVFIAGAACLTWTGHLGGKLVYEQGAAVANAKYEPCPE
jgi:uncharacterized membrane protein